MKVEVRNFRGIVAADIDMTYHLALVAGPNGSGKSSIAQAVACGLSGHTMPIELLKSEAGMLVHSGAGKGSVTIRNMDGTQTEDGTIELAYPQGKLTTTGTPPTASVYAVGLKSVCDLEPKARASVLIEYLKALPDADHIERALTAVGLEPAQRTHLAALIVELGWDGAHQRAKETGIKLKGRWETLTAERYGTAKGESWLPKAWEPDLASASEESLQALLTQAREFVEAAIATTAVSEAEREQLQKAAAMKGDLIMQQGTAAQAVADRQKALTVVADVLALIPLPSAQELCEACPHCQLAIVVRGGKLFKPTRDANPDEDAKNTLLRTEADRRVAEASTALRVARDKQAEVDLNLKRAIAAGEKLKGLPAVTAAADLERAREGATLAERRLAAFLAKRDADRTHAGILVNIALQALLAPDGLRLTCLRQAVRAFNTGIGIWGSSVVELNDDLTVTYGGRPWVLLSQSEQFRCRVSVQMAMAMKDGSQALVIDGADILDSTGRNQLISMIVDCGLSTLVCMTMPADKVPNMGELGNSYWLNEGVALERVAAAV